MINFILNVHWEGYYRFRLINEPGKTLAQSDGFGDCVRPFPHEGLTRWLFAYDRWHSRLWRHPLVGRDKKILGQIRQYLNRPEGIQQLEAVCFVVQASLPRLTPTQIYIFEVFVHLIFIPIQLNLITFSISVDFIHFRQRCAWQHSIDGYFRWQSGLIIEWF